MKLFLIVLLTMIFFAGITQANVIENPSNNAAQCLFKKGKGKEGTNQENKGRGRHGGKPREDKGEEDRPGGGQRGRDVPRGMED